MVTDDEGQRAFALVNKATGLALVNKNLITPSDNVVHVSDEEAASPSGHPASPTTIPPSSD
jgi:hypothetical protein